MTLPTRLSADLMQPGEHDGVLHLRIVHAGPCSDRGYTTFITRTRDGAVVQVSGEARMPLASAASGPDGRIALTQRPWPYR